MMIELLPQARVWSKYLKVISDQTWQYLSKNVHSGQATQTINNNIQAREKIGDIMGAIS